MTIDVLVKKLYDALATWAKPQGLKVSLARDPFDSLEVLAVGPAEALIVVSWAGDAPVDPVMGPDDDLTGAVEHSLEIIVGQGLGLEFIKDWRLIAGRGNRKSLLSRVDQVRKFVLSLVYPDDQETLGRFEYKGTEPFTTPEGIPLAAFRMRFSIVASVDEAASDVQLT